MQQRMYVPKFRNTEKTQGILAEYKILLQQNLHNRDHHENNLEEQKLSTDAEDLFFETSVKPLTKDLLQKINGVVRSGSSVLSPFNGDKWAPVYVDGKLIYMSPIFAETYVDDLLV